MSRTLRRIVGITGAAALLAVPTLPSQAVDAPSGTHQEAGDRAAAAPLSVTDALSRQDGSTQTVRGYVVGQPTATDTVITEGFATDYAIGIAATAGETDTDKILFVQMPSALRSQWGLASNPDLVGEQVDVTGDLGSYFSHAGMTGTSAIAAADGSEPEEPGEPTDPGEYYAGTEGLSGQALKDELHSIISDQTV
ncbi:MAG: DUF6359 domain-containing protein, partial [Nocardioidaceae bacterium]|nr:DUF6359 domain-containing protein [Nocardioidaceae bacterium]